MGIGDLDEAHKKLGHSTAQPKLDAGDKPLNKHQVAGECCKRFGRNYSLDDAVMLASNFSFTAGIKYARAQPVPSQSDEAAASKYHDDDLSDVSVAAYRGFLAGCQLKEHSLRGAFTSNEKDKLVKDIQGMKACIAEYEKDYAEWVEDRHALGKEITELKSANEGLQKHIREIHKSTDEAAVELKAKHSREIEKIETQSYFRGLEVGDQNKDMKITSLEKELADALARMEIAKDALAYYALPSLNYDSARSVAGKALALLEKGKP